MITRMVFRGGVKHLSRLQCLSGQNMEVDQEKGNGDSCEGQVPGLQDEILDFLNEKQAEQYKTKHAAMEAMIPKMMVMRSPAVVAMTW